MPLFLRLIFQCQTLQVFSEQDVVIRNGDIPVGCLSIQSQLFIGSFQPDLSGTNGGIQFTPSIQRLRQGHIDSPAKLTLGGKSANLLAAVL